jgi:hypothetical protein
VDWITAVAITAGQTARPTGSTTGSITATKRRATPRTSRITGRTGTRAKDYAWLSKMFVGARRKPHNIGQVIGDMLRELEKEGAIGKAPPPEDDVPFWRWY